MFLSLALLYQGAAFAYSGMPLCAGNASSVAMASAPVAVPDPCCPGQSGETGSGPATAADCGSMSGCSVPVVAFLDRPLAVPSLVTDSPVMLDPVFRSLDIREVWRPPLAV
ncbi:MAG: hypothetical protein R3E68_12075 [Burkholderiaceae bacterium]